MKPIHTFLLCAAALVFAMPAFAHRSFDFYPGGPHPGHRHGSDRNLSPALDASVRDFHTAGAKWAETNVFPTLLEWKQQFDAGLEPEDLATLNELRARAADLRRRGSELFDRIDAARTADDKEALREHREQMHDLFSERRELAGEVMPIIEKYREQLTALRKQARPTRTEWREERDRQWHDWFARASALAQTDDDRQFLERMEHRHDRRAHSKARRHGFRAAIRFLLWDGVIDNETTPGTGKAAPAFGREGTPGEAVSPELRTFPNPADDNTSLAFSTPEAGTVTVTLYDALGNTVSVPVSRFFEAGEHIVGIPTRELPSGVYRYSIEVNGAQQSGSIQVVH